jgi:hypothetical protein
LDPTTTKGGKMVKWKEGKWLYISKKKKRDGQMARREQTDGVDGK